MVYLSGASLPRLPGKKAVKRMYVCVSGEAFLSISNVVKPLGGHGSAPDPTGGAYSASPNLDGEEGLVTSSQEPYPCSQPFWPRTSWPLVSHFNPSPKLKSWICLWYILTLRSFCAICLWSMNGLWTTKSQSANAVTVTTRNALREHKPPPIQRIRISDFGLPDPKRDPDRHQTCITWSLSHALPIQKISSKSIHKFASNPMERQTNRPNQKHNLLLRWR